MIEKIKEELELLNDANNTEYENFLKKSGYLLALRNHELITFNEFMNLLKDL